MTTFPVNKPVLLAVGATTLATVTVTAVPPQGLFYGYNVPTPVLTLNDSATLAGANSGNSVWSMPLTAMPSLLPGQTIQMQHSCSAGLVVSAVPPGVACLVSY